MHDELDEKVARLARLATTRGLGGILLSTQPNFSWLTGGRSNQVDVSRENGSGGLLVSARGQRFVVANNIEMPRLHDEALAGLGFTPCEYAWTREQADPGMAIASAKHLVCGDVGCVGRDLGHVIGNALLESSTTVPESEPVTDCAETSMAMIEHTSATHTVRRLIPTPLKSLPTSQVFRECR